MPEKRKPESIANSGLHKAPRIWVMVADRRTARIFSKRGDDISLTAEITPEIRKESKIADKNIGRVASSGRGAVRHKYEPHMNESHKEELAFVHKIAAFFDTEAGKDSFDRLVLVAPPHVLGELRKTVSQQVYARIIAEVNKDLTKMNDTKLRHELEKVLWF